MEAAAGAQKAALAPTALTLRGRSQGREGFCSEDEKDYRAAMADQEEFTNKHSHSEHRRRADSEVANFDASTSVHGRAASTEHAGGLKQMKDKRQRKKEQAARELEERRKSLAKCA
ncbi:hypothetical protein FOCG_18477 [Fusarium oxysporum f. sp. radicis-lycopersici 26381]|nr:hypothetical protein FOCG_18477 [Fusarium oxysporum f. sp. radicis-lycopersici 26381]